MSKELEYTIKVDEKGAIKGIKKVGSELDKLGDKADKAKDQTEAVGESGGKAKKGLDLFKKGIKGIGTAIKASPLALLAAVLATVFEVMRKNQKVLDALETATNFIQVAFSAVTDALGNAYDAMGDMSGGLDGLISVVENVIKIALAPFQLVLLNLQTGFAGLQLAYESVFGDDESVEKAKQNLVDLKDEYVDLATETLTAFGDIGETVGNGISNVVGAVGAVVTELGKISPSELLDTASNMTKLGNSAEVAAAKQAGLVEEYDRLAEKQRQIRDDESLSIEERKKANDELGKILEKSEKAQLRQADLQVASAAAQYKANKNQENYIALINAETNKKGVLAQIEGFRSEQKVNAVALLKEEIELTNALAEADTTLAFDKRRFAAEQITDLELRLATLLSINKDEAKAEETRLTEKRDSFKEGTQAYVDAQIELDARKEEFRQNEISLEAQEKQRKIDERQLEIDDATNSFEQKKQLLADRRQELLDDESLSEAERLKMLKANSMAASVIAKAEADAKIDTLNQVGSALGAFSALAGKDTADGKALAVAQATISTYAGMAGIWGAKPEGTATTTLVAKIAASAAVAANGFAAVKGILNTEVPGPAGGGGGGGAPPAPSSPTFNVVGQSPNSIGNAQSVSNNQIDNNNNNPQRAYVVSTDITNQQALDRDIEDSNALG